MKSFQIVLVATIILSLYLSFREVKNAKKAAKPTPKPKLDLDTAIIFEKMKELSYGDFPLEAPLVSFELEKCQCDILDNKIGGSFYVPLHLSIPKNPTTGSELVLLAQLNFACLPEIEYFPKSGLLQIFIPYDSDTYGCGFSFSNTGSEWEIRYIDIPTDMSKGRIVSPNLPEDSMLPFPNYTEYLLKPRLEKQMMTVCDHRFNKPFYDACLYLGVEADAAFEVISEEKGYPCQIGGFPMFTQGDPRENTENPLDILLFQLDSTLDIMWGDCGIANFFISSSDLQKRDFSRTIYNWDCY